MSSLIHNKGARSGREIVIVVEIVYDEVDT